MTHFFNLDLKFSWGRKGRVRKTKLDEKKKGKLDGYLIKNARCGLAPGGGEEREGRGVDSEDLPCSRWIIDAMRCHAMPCHADDGWTSAMARPRPPPLTCIGGSPAHRPMGPFASLLASDVERERGQLTERQAYRTIRTAKSGCPYHGKGREIGTTVCMYCADMEIGWRWT